MPSDSEVVASSLQDTYRLLRQIAGAMMRGERPNHTLSPTAVVNEAVLRLLARTESSLAGEAMASRVSLMMRRVLIEHARRHQAKKRNGGVRPVSIELTEPSGRGLRVPDLVAFDLAMEALGRAEPRQALVVNMKFFGDMTHPEIAGVLGVSEPTVEREWKAAKAWLKRELTPGE